MHGTELEVGADLLAFDLVETEQLFHGMGVAVSGDRLHQLWNWAEGWPAVLYLSGLALRDGRAMQRTAPSSPDMVRDFLRDNILDSLDPEIADVAMKCALLDKIDGPLAVAVTGRSDAEAHVRTLSKAFGLIRSLDPDATEFRMHSLLRTFLSDELHAASVQTWRDTHLAACRALAAAGDLDAAVGHAVAADSDEDLKRIVWPLAVDLLTSGRTPVVRRWLDAAGPERIAAIPELAVSAAWSEQHEGDLAAMARYAALAERMCLHQQCEHLHLPLLRVSMAVDGVADMERTSESLVARMDPADPALPTALYHLGAARVLLKRSDDAVALLEASRRMSEVLDQHVIHAIAASELGIARLQAGDRRGGLDALVEARHVLHHHQMDTALVAVIPYAASAYGYALEGRSVDARDHLNVAVRLVSRLRGSAPWFAVRAILQLASAALSTGDASRARDLVRTAEREYGAGNACPANDELLADLRQAIQNVDDLPHLPESLTMAEMRVMQYLPTHLSFPDIANQLNLSRFTVKTQALAIYRKLGVHSRHEAVGRARTIGLIPPG
jgi:LuxR family maltose regulon positive regulatory protein